MQRGDTLKRARVSAAPLPAPDAAVGGNDRGPSGRASQALGALLGDRALRIIGACRSWPLAWRLGLAILAVIAGVIARLALLGPVEERFLYITLYPAVAVAAILGGFWGGATAMVLSAFAAHSLFAPLRDNVDWLGLATFLVSSSIISGMAEALHVAQGRLATADKIKESADRLRRFIEEAPAALAMFDRDMRYLAASRRWLTNYCPHEGDIIGRLYYEVLPNLPESWKEAHRRGLAGEVLPVDEVPFPREDGCLQYDRWEIRPWHEGDGRIGGITIFGEDVTKRVEAGMALKDSEARLRAIVDTAIDAILVINESGLIQSINPATETIFGYDAHELIGQNIELLMPDEPALLHDGQIGASKRTGVGKIICIGREVVARRKDGSTFPLDLAIAAWRDAKDQRFFTGIMRDITGRRRTEEALARTRRLQAVGQLAGGIAHDFNNLLSVIAGNLELAEPRIKDDKTRQLVMRAREAADAGAGFNRRLLSLAPKAQLVPVHLVLNSRVEETAKLLERTLGENIALTTDLAPDLWPTRADAGEIESAILNLAVNARDAMPEGGTLIIRTRNATLSAAAAELDPEAQPGDYVRLSIADTGAGMSHEVLQRAIEPFFTTKEPGKGTGLGLSSVFSFVKQSGGFVTLASELGQGTTVCLYLPRAAPQLATSGVPADNKHRLPQGDGELVLVVEDNDEVREVTLKRLELLGYAVLEARTGPEAIQWLNSDEPIALVLSDVVMPGNMTGYDVARWVLSTKPHVKVLLTSGYSIGDSTRDDRLAHIHILGKPHTLADLARSVRELLDSHNVQAGPTAPVNT